MKKVRTLLIITLCFAFTITSTNFDAIYEIAPSGHYDENIGDF